jgi:hypothetical protein
LRPPKAAFDLGFHRGFSGAHRVELCDHTINARAWNDDNAVDVSHDNVAATHELTANARIKPDAPRPIGIGRIGVQTVAPGSQADVLNAHKVAHRAVRHKADAARAVVNHHRTARDMRVE